MIRGLNTVIQSLQKLIPKSVTEHIPEPIILLYHRLVNAISVIQYKKPSRKLIIVGVTGTNGKTTTTLLIRDIVKSAGIKVGLLGTTEITIGDEVMPNDMHTTMLGRGLIHMQLRKMVNAGCKIAIVETTSEGIKQYRHEGVEYDIVVFTNLTPEHLQSHGGSFENYKRAKMTIFKDLHKRFKKENVPKVIFANVDDKHGKDFLQHKADKKIGFGLNSGDVKAKHVTIQDSITFSLSDETAEKTYTAPLPGKFNVYNTLAAVLVSRELGLNYNQVAEGLKNIPGIPGRMEVIDEGQDFRVFLDFAHEGMGIQNAFGALQEFRKDGHKVIGLVGGIGGGRDRRNRFEIGKYAAELADILIVTTQDPYDDDQVEIINDIVSTAKEKLVLNKSLFTKVDRRDGIRKALSLAKTGDTVIIAGKGVELTMIVKGKTIPWNEHQIVREEVRARVKNSKKHQ